MTPDTTAERMAVPSATAEIDLMDAPAMAIVQPVTAADGIGKYTDIYLYTGPQTDAYRAWPLRLRWFLTPKEAAGMARTLRQVADAIDAGDTVRIEDGA